MSFLRKISTGAAAAFGAAAGLALCQADSIAPTVKNPRSVVKSGAAGGVKKSAIEAKPRFALYGPPLPRDRALAAQQAETLRGFLKTGRLRFVNSERDGQQLFCVARDGLYLWPPATPQALASASFVPAAAPAPRPRPRLASRSGGNGTASRFAPPGLSGAPNLSDVPEAKTPDAPLPAPPDPHLMAALATLAARSAPMRPLEVLSLFRPPYRTAYWRHGGPGTLHSHGMAVDIAAYGGHRITQSDPEGCVRMALDLLRDLPPGSYRLGLPKAPDAPLVVGHVFLPPALDALAYPKTGAAKGKKPLPSRGGKGQRGAAPPSSAPPDFFPPSLLTLALALGVETCCPPPAWPFFPAPQPDIKDGVIAATKPGGSQARVARFQNEAYAPAESLSDIRLRDAIKQAAKRGVVVVGLFPDGADHIHLDVKSRR